MASLKYCLYVITAVVVFLLLTYSGEVEAARTRGRLHDSRMSHKKIGRCPPRDVVDGLTNTVCADDECDLDVDCPGTKKCCNNSCGGKSCVLPQDYDEVTAVPTVVSEVDVQSGSLTVNEGETAVLYCNASSRIPTSYGWILVRPGTTLPIIDVFPPGSTIGNKIVSNDGRKITVLGARVEDSANYACVAASLLGYVTNSYQLHVHAAYVTTDRPLTTSRLPVESNQMANEPPTNMPPGDQVQPELWPQLAPQYIPELSNKLSTTVAPSPMTTAAAPPTNVIAPSQDSEDSDPGAVQVNPICLQPRYKGTCTMEETRWFYNVDKQKCEQFVYGGCNGNLNNFHTFDDCNRTCPYHPERPCESPIFTGPCRARFMRWAYDRERGECIQFVYGGCRKNGNNFETRDQCMATCFRPPTYRQIPVSDSKCRCVKPRLKTCYCSSEFAIAGTVIQKHNSYSGDILVVEVENVFKQGTLALRQSSSMTNNVTVIRDMSQQGESCQCHRLEPNDVSYIIMGYVNTYGDAEIDSTSYVGESTPRRAGKLTSQIQRSQACRLSSRQRLSERAGPRGRAQARS